jgi:hypothetical protein
VRITVVGQSVQVRATLAYLDAQGGTLGFPSVFAPGQVAEAVRVFPAGTVTSSMDGVDCDGSIDVVADQETDVLAWINWFEEPRCILQSVRTHPSGAAHAGDRGQLVVLAAPGADVRIKRLDVIGLAPVKGPPDVQGYVAFVELPAGWFETSLTEGDDVVFRTPVELAVGGARSIDVVIPPPAVPLECVDVGRRPCEAAMLEAWSYGMYPRTQEIGPIASVTVGPATLETCQSEPGSINELEATFEFEDKTSYTVQLTRTPPGYLHACPAY